MPTRLHSPAADASAPGSPAPDAEGAPRILVVIGHPLADSLNHALADAYITAARAAGAEVRVHDLARVRIPPTESIDQLRAWNGATDALDPAVQPLIADVRWAEHIVIQFPQWWGTYPGALSHYLDRVMLSGVAFRYKKGQIPHRLLRGRTARLLMTADAPAWWNRVAYRSAAETSLARATLGYTGIRVRGITRFMQVRFSTPARRARWLDTAAALGTRDARALARTRAPR